MRRVKYKILMNGKNATKDISDFVSELVYTDSIEEKAKEELNLIIHNPDDRRFLKDWYIDEGTEIEASIIYKEGNKNKEFYLGKFITGDDITARQKGAILSVKATSQSYEDLKELKRKRNEAYENIKLSDLVSKIIHKCNKNAFINVPDIILNRIDIVNQTYEQFLKQLARRYDCHFFIRKNTIVFSADLPPTNQIDISSYIIDDNVKPTKNTNTKSGSIKKVIVEYYKPNSKKTQFYVWENPEVKSGKEIRVYGIAHNLQEAREWAKRYASKKSKEGNKQSGNNLVIYGLPINAGDIVILPEKYYGKLAGKYKAVKIQHSVKKEEGWKTNLTIEYTGG